MRTQRKKTKKVIRGGGRFDYTSIRIEDKNLLPRKLADPNATVYYGPAISHKGYRYGAATDHFGGYYHTFACMLNTTDACKNAAAKVEYCANKLYNNRDEHSDRYSTSERYSSSKLDNYYKDNMNQIFEESGCYAFLDFIIRANRQMMGHEFNNYDTFIVILKGIFDEKFFDESFVSVSKSEFFKYLDYTRVKIRSGLFNGKKYDAKSASYLANKYKSQLDRFLSVWSTKTLNDRYERVMALKEEVEALEAASEKAT